MNNSSPLKKIKVAIHTLGCKLNQAESENLARELAKAGYILASASEKADIYVVNSCTVTNIADQKTRQALRNMQEANPNALIIATGCYAERAPEELLKIEGVKYAFGNREKERLVELLANIDPVFVPADTEHGLEANLRTRAFIRVQDGCSNYCVYCIVPYVRGIEKSRSSTDIIAEIKSLVHEGYKEVVLTGTEIGAYKDGNINLEALVKQILSETDILRLRLSSLQPPEITRGLLNLWGDHRLCRHFHLSLQSGSDRVLNRMRRRYTTADYREVVSSIRAFLPGSAITTDIITGFPGETGHEFEESYSFCQEMQFARIHVFSYSPRPGTAAAAISGQIDGRIKKERNRRMLALSRVSTRNFLEEFLDKTITVLFEKPDVNQTWSGLTDNYIKVYTKSSRDLSNILMGKKLVKIYHDGLWGEDNE